MRALAMMLLLCVVGSHPALANEAKGNAKNLYEQGLRQYNLGHFQEALTHFESAYQAVPDAAFLFNIGQCHRALGDASAAVHAYRAYLREAPSAPNRAEVERLRAELDQTLERERQQKQMPPVGTSPPGSAQPSATESAPKPEPGPSPSSPPAPPPPAVDLTPTSPVVMVVRSDRASPRRKLGWIVGGAVGGVVVVAGVAIGLGLGLSAHAAPSPSFATPVSRWSNH